MENNLVAKYIDKYLVQTNYGDYSGVKSLTLEDLITLKGFIEYELYLMKELAK